MTTAYSSLNVSEPSLMCRAMDQSVQQFSRFFDDTSLASTSDEGTSDKIGRIYTQFILIALCAIPFFLAALPFNAIRYFLNEGNPENYQQETVKADQVFQNTFNTSNEGIPDSTAEQGPFYNYNYSPYPESGEEGIPSFQRSAEKDNRYYEWFWDEFLRQCDQEDWSLPPEFPEDEFRPEGSPPFSEFPEDEFRPEGSPPPKPESNWAPETEAATAPLPPDPKWMGIDTVEFMKLTPSTDASDKFKAAIQDMRLAIENRDMWQIFGLDSKADPADLAKSFKQLRLTLHPDKNRDDDELARLAFIAVQEAHTAATSEKS